ncbi:unnamed protein product [Clavelina lepadiformis]|uniref:Uncharacterized protein n=1 Tax=Clavelina lepadiformis TaxID=159417 RepID=A0ABP0F9W1_CLALP
MECHPDNTHIDFFLKEISDLISQEFQSIRQDMKIEFVKVQENMEDMVSKILAETKKAEIINNPIPINKTSQALVVESDMGICIKGVCSENASVFPLVEAIEEEPLHLQHWEVSETDNPSISISNMFFHQSEIGVNAGVQTVEPQTCIVKDHFRKASVYPQFDVIEEKPLSLQKYAVSQTEIDDSNISMLKKFPPQSKIGLKATVKTLDARNCIERSSDEEHSDSVEMFFDISATNNRNKACKIQTQTMECHPVGMQVDILLKAFSDMLSQEFKSMRQDMKKEFVKMQESMEDVTSTLLAEIKKTETMNNEMPVEETSQTTVVKSDISLNIKEVYSEKAPVFPLVESIKEEPLLLEEDEDSHTEVDDPSISMLNKFLPQSDIGVNATVKIVKPQSRDARNSDEECIDSVEMNLNKSIAIERTNACKVDAQLLRCRQSDKFTAIRDAHSYSSCSKSLFGIKFWMLCDATTYYVLQVFLLLEKKTGEVDLGSMWYCR